MKLEDIKDGAFAVFLDQSLPARKGSFLIESVTDVDGAPTFVKLKGYKNPMLNHLLLALDEERTAKVAIAKAEMTEQQRIQAAAEERKLFAMNAGALHKQTGGKYSGNPHGAFTVDWTEWSRGYKSQEAAQRRELPRATKIAKPGEARKAREEENRRRSNRK